MQTVSRTLKAAIAASILFRSTGAALAASEADFYAGGSLGFGAIAPDNLKVDRKYDNADAKLSAGFFVGGRLGALPVSSGWQLWLEAGVQDIARHRIRYDTAAGKSELTASGRTAYLAAKVDIPLTERFALYGKLGAARNRVSASVPAGQPPIDIAGSKTGVLTGFGAQYAFDNGITLRGEITGLGKSSKNSSAGVLNFAAAYRF